MTTGDSRATGRAPDVTLDDVQRQCEALRARLDARLDGRGPLAEHDERTTLRAEISALIRTAEAQARAWRALADAARALPELWKRLPDAVPPAPVSGSTRQDHLGASTFVAKGWDAYAAADLAAAERAFERALALTPDEPEIFAMLAWVHAARGDVDAALVGAQRVLVARPRGPAASLARVAVGRACLAKGILGEAVEHLARVVRDDDDRRAVLYATLYLGVTYSRREMYDDAVACLRRALRLGPNLVEARYELGWAHWRADAHHEARAEWRAGATGAFGPWAQRCRKRLAELEGGDAVGA
ncbi:hypothetical protein tb265_28690 [Gemmatimonadetes bacterium T265]|nr:hypothetical protein tb265_28690 [Gemmatimonadetes bacterium T265]